MPTVLRVGPYRFFFYSEEGSEPPHVHIEAAERRAKFWLSPIGQVWNDGFRSGELKEIETTLQSIASFYWRRGMDFSSVEEGLIPVRVAVDDAMIRVAFDGGLEIATPVARFPRLMSASLEQRNQWRLIGRGDGIHWSEIDEDISVRTLLSLPKKKPRNRMEEIPALIGDLLKTTERLSKLFDGRPFTPDGHLVGSIGEVVAEYIYDLKLEPASRAQVDAYIKDGRSVQIKLTGKTGLSYRFRWPASEGTIIPDLLIALRLTRSGFEEVYNGLFPAELLQNRPKTSNGQLSIRVATLKSMKCSLLGRANSFEDLNRSFPKELRDIA